MIQAAGPLLIAGIAFTAVLGVLVVIGLPFLPVLLHMTGLQCGVLAGLTVYAVPQVLLRGAAGPGRDGPPRRGGGADRHAGEADAVLMLGPVVLGLSLLTRRMRDETDEAAPHLTAGDRPKPGRLPLHKLVPWFIVGFLALAALRSASLVPTAALAPAATTANLLTIISMAALGLGTDLKVVARVGARVIAAVTFSLLFLGAISFGLIQLIGIG